MSSDFVILEDDQTKSRIQSCHDNLPGYSPDPAKDSYEDQHIGRIAGPDSQTRHPQESDHRSRDLRRISVSAKPQPRTAYADQPRLIRNTATESSPMATYPLDLIVVAILTNCVVPPDGCCCPLDAAAIITDSMIEQSSKIIQRSRLRSALSADGQR